MYGIVETRPATNLGIQAVLSVVRFCVVALYFCLTQVTTMGSEIWVSCVSKDPVMRIRAALA